MLFILIFLLGLAIDRPIQVWCTNISDIPLAKGFVYLIAVMDWFSRRVRATEHAKEVWRLSTGMETGFCVEALQDALDRHGSPEIFNSDQGVQFTSAAFTGVLTASGVRISMDGKGRYLDNIFIERLWRSLKYEDIYIKAYASVPEARRGIGGWLSSYTDGRLHQALGYQTARGFPGDGILWIWGQRQRVDHIPTGPSSTARKGFNRIGNGAMISLPPRTGRGS